MNPQPTSSWCTGRVCRLNLCFIFSMLLLAGLVTAPSASFAQDDLPVLDTDLQVSFSGLVYDRTSNTFDTRATITNISTQTLSGDLSLVLPSLTPTSVTLANASCLTPTDQPVLLASFPANGLEPGQSLPPLLLQFSNPAQVAFTYAHTVLAGNECTSEIILHAFEDSRTLPDLNTVQETLQQFAPAYCQGTLPPNPLTLAQAMSSIQQRLTGSGLFVKMGPFTQLTVNRDGTWTLFAGVKASLVATQISAKAGFYIQGNDTDFTAAGVKLSASANVGPLTINAPIGFQAQLVGSVASPPGLQ